MGWTTITFGNPPTTEDVLKDIIDLSQLRAISVSKGSHKSGEGEMYLAVANHRNMKEVSAAVILYSVGHTGGVYEVSYKVIHESSGPIYHNASIEVLSALTHTSESYAISWRNSVRKKLNSRKNTPTHNVT